MAKTQSAHQTVRSLASSTRSSTLSILFRISARARGLDGRGGGGSVGNDLGAGSPRRAPASAGAVAGEEALARGLGGGGRLAESSSTAIFFSFFPLFSLEFLRIP